MINKSKQPFNNKAIIIAGYGKFPRGTSAEQLHKVLALVALVDPDDARVLDVSTTLATRVADDFVQAAIVGKSLTKDSANVIKLLTSRYHGMAGRAVIAAFRDLIRRFHEATSDHQESTNILEKH